MGVTVTTTDSLAETADENTGSKAMLAFPPESIAVPLVTTVTSALTLV